MDDYETVVENGINKTRVVSRAVPRLNNNFPGLGVDPLNNLTPQSTKVTSPSGATSSHKAPRYDLIPKEGIDVLAERYRLGAAIHGDRNWEKGIRDKAHILERLNHMQEHMLKLTNPPAGIRQKNTIDSYIKEQLGAIMWGCCYLAKVLNDEEGYKILATEVLNFK